MKQALLLLRKVRGSISRLIARLAYTQSQTALQGQSPKYSTASRGEEKGECPARKRQRKQRQVVVLLPNSS